ncbi:MAG: thiamine phosphate synthase [Dongiaceae bacterium]
MSRRIFDPSVYLVLDRLFAGQRDLLAVLQAALAGGVTMVQLRDKQAPRSLFLDQARRMLALLRPAGVPLIVNDRVDVALAVGADGVHVGQDDMAAGEARRLLGPDAIVGLSVSRPEECAGADPAVVDYVGLGPVFPTDTKPDTPPPLGIGGVRALRPHLGVPVVAIGGIGAGNAAGLVGAGADGVAVVSAICAAPDPEAASRRLARAVAAGKARRRAAP